MKTYGRPTLLFEKKNSLILYFLLILSLRNKIIFIIYFHEMHTPRL